MVAGTLPLGRDQSLKYKAAYLMGSDCGRNTNRFALRLQYAY